MMSSVTLTLTLTLALALALTLALTGRMISSGRLSPSDFIRSYRIWHAVSISSW